MKLLIVVIVVLMAVVALALEPPKGLRYWQQLLAPTNLKVTFESADDNWYPPVGDKPVIMDGQIVYMPQKR